MPDHERIWLQHSDDAEGQETGRMWCQDKVWPNHPEDHEPTEYVRADLLAAAEAEIERLRKPLKIEVCRGQIGLALYVNDTRIAGPRHNGRMEMVLAGTYTRGGDDGKAV